MRALGFIVRMSEVMHSAIHRLLGRNSIGPVLWRAGLGAAAGIGWRRMRSRFVNPEADSGAGVASEETLRELIKQGESERLESKTSLRWDASEAVAHVEARKASR